MSRQPSQPRPDASSSTSRRSFLRYASLAAAAPIFSEAHFAHAARRAIEQSATQPLGGIAPRVLRQAAPANAVLINANENPLGPCAAACEIIAKIAPQGGRYDVWGETDKLTKTVAAQTQLPEDHIAVYAGSTDPLHFTVLTFTSPTRGLVQADPTFEAAGRAAQAAGAKVSLVPLTANYAHDLKAMVAADPSAGVLYICNPNNPTGTVTPREEIEWALQHKPKGSILLVDEAYIHLSDTPSMIGHVARGEDLILLRTFSKLYGMAGLRCGLALGRPDLLARLNRYGQNPMVITGAAAANVSLLDPQIVATRKKITADTRRDTIDWLSHNHFKVLGQPESNCFMIDTGRNGKSVIAAMQAKDIYIGRTWPIWPNAVRITVGTPDEMAKFKTAFHSVMNAPLTA